MQTVRFIRNPAHVGLKWQDSGDGSWSATNISIPGLPAHADAYVNPDLRRGGIPYGIVAQVSVHWTPTPAWAGDDDPRVAVVEEQMENKMRFTWMNRIGSGGGYHYRASDPHMKSIEEAKSWAARYLNRVVDNVQLQRLFNS